MKLQEKKKKKLINDEQFQLKLQIKEYSNNTHSAECVFVLIICNH